MAARERCGEVSLTPCGSVPPAPMISMPYCLAFLAKGKDEASPQKTGCGSLLNPQYRISWKRRKRQEKQGKSSKGKRKNIPKRGERSVQSFHCDLQFSACKTCELDLKGGWEGLTFPRAYAGHIQKIKIKYPPHPPPKKKNEQLILNLSS